jgi:hypothetical protein
VPKELPNELLVEKSIKEELMNILSDPMIISISDEEVFSPRNPRKRHISEEIEVISGDERKKPKVDKF